MSDSSLDASDGEQAAPQQQLLLQPRSLQGTSCSSSGKGLLAPQVQLDSRLAASRNSRSKENRFSRVSSGEAAGLLRHTPPAW